MKLTEIRDLTLLDSGQFVVGDLSLMNMSLYQFWLIVQRSLSYYQKYRPVTKDFTIEVSDQYYTFIDDIPEWISKVYPVNVSAMLSLFASNSQFDNTQSTVWKYNKPTLYIGFASLVSLTACYNYSYTITGTSPNITEVDIPDITAGDTKFLDHVRANFMIALGRSRRAFTNQDFPVTMDGDLLISEGQLLLDATQDLIQANSLWQLSLGG